VRGREVLDVGCGEGWLVRRLAEHGAARVVGADPLEVALARARAQDPDGSYVVAGAQALPFEDASFDATVMFNSLHHVPVEHMDAGLSEVARVLRPDGRLYVQEPLAEGPFFELIRSVDDETEVRGAARAALERAVAAGTLRELDTRTAVMTVRLGGFDAWRRHVASVEPSRVEAIDAQRPQLEEAFDRLGRRDGDEHVFAQPVLVKLLGRT
jgi:ubiquinone/menaquinone biosynthesis C-methylase UbiE